MLKRKKMMQIFSFWMQSFQNFFISLTLLLHQTLLYGKNKCIEVCKRDTTISCR